MGLSEDGSGQAARVGNRWVQIDCPRRTDGRVGRIQGGQGWRIEARGGRTTPHGASAAAAQGAPDGPADGPAGAGEELIVGLTLRVRHFLTRSVRPTI